MCDPIEQSQILAQIIAGLNSAYFENLALCDPDTDVQTKVTEYLFTVNVAQKLLELKRDGGLVNTAIKLEHDAGEFINGAFPRFKLNPQRIRCQHVPVRNGRIDISILRKSNMEIRSTYGIEVKGINPSTDLIKKDLKRLAHAMEERDIIGTNSICKCYCAFIRRLDTEEELYSEPDIDLRLVKLKSEIISEYSKAISGFSKLHLCVELDIIYSSTCHDYANNIPYEYTDYEEAVESTGAAIGVIIVIARLAVPLVSTNMPGNNEPIK